MGGILSPISVAGEQSSYSCGYGAEDAQRLITQPLLTRVHPVSWPVPFPLPGAHSVDRKGN